MKEQTKSKSLYIDENNSNKIHLDDFGNPLNGVRIDGEKWDKDKTKVIIRFRNGLLDGDIYIGEKYIRTKPAVETPNGHVEYWRKGKLHRDGKLAAVCSEGLLHKEYWVNGKRVQQEKKQ